MKNKTALLFLILSSVSCSTEMKDDGEAFVPVDIVTRADGDAAADVQVVAFRESGGIAAFSGGTGTRTLRLRRGESYDILAFMACPDLDRAGMTTKEAVLAENMDMALYNDPGGDFAASAFTRIGPVVASSRSVALEAERYVCRVRLVSVRNMLPPSMGSVVLKNAFLSNVVASQTLGAVGSGWLNPMGRATENPAVESHVIDGVNHFASAPGLTFKKFGKTVAYGSALAPAADFYCYPNPASTDIQGFSSDMGSRYTRLVLTVELGGQTRYYPINLVNLQRNSSYDVSVTISNLGSGDPDMTMDSGAITSEITMSAWDVGNEIPTNF